MRECGNCCLCCKLMGLEVGKPMFVWCRSCRPNSRKPCLIYEGRPDECQRFECLWLRGVLPEWCKPDVVGFVAIASVKPDEVVIVEDIPGDAFDYPDMFREFHNKKISPKILNRENMKIHGLKNNC